MSKRSKTLLARLLATAELPALALVPLTMVGLALAGVTAAAGCTLLVAVLALVLVAAGFEASRPSLRTLMPTAVLAAAAAAGRVVFAPFPDVKPVSAIAIMAGVALGRRSGFLVGALAALLSNAFFGQGSWTPWQMYAWGLVGYLAGVLADVGWMRSSWAVTAYGAASGLLYGALLNGYFVLGFVRPLTWPAVLAAYGSGVPFDALHGISTAAFLLVLWAPWSRIIRRAVVRHGLAERTHASANECSHPTDADTLE